MYFELSEKLPNNCIEKEEILLDRIKNIDIKKESEKTIKFKEEFVEKYGEARKYIDQII